MQMTLQDLIPILQVSIGPVILISGVGLLLLSMTNRLGRVIDRARVLSREYRDVGAAQLPILMRRARLLRAAIALASLSVLLAAVLIIVLFVAASIKLNLALVIAGLFVGCMITLIVSMGLFIADVNLTLSALKLEVDALTRRHGSGNESSPQ